MSGDYMFVCMINFDFITYGAGLITIRSYSTKRLTKVQRDSLTISSELAQVIIGVLMADASIERRAINHNARLVFKQGSINEAYLLHLYAKFKDYCGSAPKTSDSKPDLRTGKIYSSIRFTTYSLPCLNYYHELFYVNRVKIIPLNIANLLTDVGLAFSLGNGRWRLTFERKFFLFMYRFLYFK